MSRRYPFAPLAAAMGLNESQACRRLGLSGRTEQIYRKTGMTEIVADRQAVKAGLTPYEVWPEMVEHAIAEADTAEQERRAARNAKKAAWKRRRYAEDPEFAERRRAERRAYYEACRAYELARQARYDAEHADELAAKQKARRRKNPDTASLIGELSAGSVKQPGFAVRSAEYKDDMGPELDWRQTA